MGEFLPPSAADLREAEKKMREKEDGDQEVAKNASIPGDEVNNLLNAPENSPEKTSIGAEVSGIASSWGAGWGAFTNSISWGTIVDTVKKQSELVADIYKRDLSEFVTIVASNANPNQETTETDTAENETVTSRNAPGPERPDGQPAKEIPSNASGSIQDTIASTVANLEALADTAEDFLEHTLTHVGSGITSFLTSAISISTPEASPNISKTKAILYLVLRWLKLIPLRYDRKTAAIAELWKAPLHFIEDPAKSSADVDFVKRYSDFRESFIISNHSTAIARLLNDNEDAERLYKRIGSEIEREEEARKRLLSATSVHEEEVGWESEDENDDQVPKADASETIPTESKPDDDNDQLKSPELVNASATSVAIPSTSTSPTIEKKDADVSESSYEIVSGVDSAPEVTAIEAEKKQKPPKAADDSSDWGDDWE
ncbi:hypothetical protein HDU67_001580 [Dinochytrium kinnereticum]|nr:hypothetical protein HDU67_001580 [Dinochytrium kinnereticum]